MAPGYVSSDISLKHHALAVLQSKQRTFRGPLIVTEITELSKRSFNVNIKQIVRMVDISTAVCHP